MSKQLTESLIRLGGIYFMITSVIGISTVIVKYFESVLSNRMIGMSMGIGDLFWLACPIVIWFVIGVIIIKKSDVLAGVVVRDDKGA